MEKKLLFRKGSAPLLARLYKNFVVLSPEKSRFKNFLNRKTVWSRNDFLTIQFFSMFVGAFVIGIIGFPLIISFMHLYPILGLLGALSWVLTLPGFYIGLGIFLLPLSTFIFSDLGEKGKFDNEKERVRLKIPDNQSKHLDKVPEELIHKYYEKCLEVKGTVESLDFIEKSFDEKMSDFLHKDLMQKRREVLAKSQKAKAEMKDSLLKIDTITKEFSHIDEQHHNQDERMRADEEAIKVLSLLNKKDSKEDEQVEYIEKAADSKKKYW